MSDLERLRAAYQRFNATGELDWELLDPDVEWGLFAFAPTQGYAGREGVKRWLADIGEMFEGLRIEPSEFVELGDKVVVVSRMSGRGRGSSAAVEQPLVSVWTFREGRVVRLESFQEREEALRAAAT